MVAPGTSRTPPVMTSFSSPSAWAPTTVIIRLKRIEAGLLSQAEPLVFVSDHTVIGSFAGTQGCPAPLPPRLTPRPPGRTEAPQHREAGGMDFSNALACSKRRRDQRS